MSSKDHRVMRRMRLTKSPLLNTLITALTVVTLTGIACNFPGFRQESDSSPDYQATPTVFATNDSGGKIPTGEIGSSQINPPSNGYQVTFPQTPLELEGASFIYITQSGDTLPAIAGRFGVETEMITAVSEIPSEGLLPPGEKLLIPNTLGSIEYSGWLLPDSEGVYSPSTIGFDLGEFIRNANGYLSRYSELVDGRQMSGEEILAKVAFENSINPRLLLAFLEFRSGWVVAGSDEAVQTDHPIGFFVPGHRGLYKELELTATHFGLGYYGWRSGALTRLKFRDGSQRRIYPGLNAGSVALQNLFSKFYSESQWREVLYGEDGFIQLYTSMFGDPWQRALEVEPLLSSTPGSRAILEPPLLELPFLPGERWSFTGGPHASWGSGSPRGAIDFSPVTGQAPCMVSQAWVTAAAPGRVLRIGEGVVALDLDSDGYEQTGWVLVYLHLVGTEGSPSPVEGEQVAVDQLLGHPSCERGKSTGTHVHLARKYNGEWIPADHFVPFILSGWLVKAGERSYEGFLLRDGVEITANPGGSRSSLIIRDE